MYCQYSASRMYGPRFRSAKNDLTRGKTLHPVTFRKIIFIPFCQNFIKHPKRPYIRGRYKQDALYRVVQKKGTVLLSTSLAWPAVAGCSWAETFSQLSAISFAQPCTCPMVQPTCTALFHSESVIRNVCYWHRMRWPTANLRRRRDYCFKDPR